MLAMMFSLTACSNEVEKPFDYDDSQIVIDTMYLFNQYQNVSVNMLIIIFRMEPNSSSPQ